MMKTAFLLIGVGLGLLVGFVWCASVEAKPTLVLQDELSITCDGFGWRDNALELAPELGVRAIRINMDERRRGCAAEDSAPKDIVAAGMRPQITLISDPRGDREARIAYMAARAARHADTVDLYSVWNEPELTNFKRPDGGHHTYRRFFPAARRAIRRADPGAKVCIAESSTHALGRKRWLAQTFAKRRRPVRADCLAIHPYHWPWAKYVSTAYFRKLRAFKRRVRRWARTRRLCRPRRNASYLTGAPRHRCRPVPIHITENGVGLWNGEAGDATAIEHAWRFCVRLKFRQCAQYQLFPAFTHRYSPQRWNTGLADHNCRPTATFYALRKAVTGRTDAVEGPWPKCPRPTPQSKPLPPRWGTPAMPPPALTSPPPPPVVGELVLPDQPPVTEIPEPVPEPEPEPAPGEVVPEPDPLPLPDVIEIPLEPPVEIPEPPVPSEPDPVPAVEPTLEPVPVEPPTEEPLP